MTYMEMQVCTTQRAAALLRELLGDTKNWVHVLVDALRGRGRNCLQPFCRKPLMYYREEDVRDFADAELALAAEPSTGELVVEGDSELDLLLKLKRKRSPSTRATLSRGLLHRRRLRV
jgi:hypothetical protein